MDRQDNPKEPRQSGGEQAYAVASGEYATLVKSYKGFNIFIVGNRYYALTADYGEVLPNEVVEKQHSLVSESLLELEDEVECAIAFSNSRGHFDNRFRQKVKGAFMKAESVHDNKIEDGVSPSLPSGRVIYIKELNEYFFVTPDELPSESFETIESSFLNAYYASSQPELIARIGRYNLVSFDSKIFAVQQGTPVDDMEWRTGLVSKRDDVHTFNNTQDAIRYTKSQLATHPGSASPVSFSGAPQLIETDVDRQINYVFYRGLYYAIPHRLGAINLEQIGSEIPDGVVLSDSLDSLKQFSSQSWSVGVTPSQLDASGESDVPRLLRAEAGYNVVAFGGYYFAIPQTLGAINLLETDVMSMPEIVRDVSLHVIEDYIAEQKRLNEPAPEPPKPSLAKLPSELTGQKKAEDALAQQQAQLQQMQGLIAAMKTSKFWKLRSLWFRLKQLIGLPIDDFEPPIDPNQPINIQIQQAQSIITAMKTSKFWKLRSAWFRLKKVLGLTVEEEA